MAAYAEIVLSVENIVNNTSDHYQSHMLCLMTGFLIEDKLKVSALWLGCIFVKSCLIMSMKQTANEIARAGDDISSTL